MNKDLYNILGVERNATADKIKKEYRKKCLQFHPDKQNGKSEEEKKEAEEKFKEIGEAYSILSNEELRSKYDKYGTIDNVQNDNFSGFNGMEDIINHIRNMHGFGDFGFGNQNKNRVVNGSNIKISVSCTLEDVYNGVTKTYKYKRKVKCSECNGSGSLTQEVQVCPYCNGTGVETITTSNGYMTQIHQKECSHCHGTGKTINNPCHKCNGSGLETVEEIVEVKIPSYIEEGMTVVIPEKGNMAPNNLGNAGNLIVQFNIQKHDVFGLSQSNNGIDLVCKTSVNVIDCILGCEKTIKGIDGKDIKVTIPKFTKDGSHIKIKGNGMPCSSGGFCDLYVIIQQEMPTDLSTDEIKMLDELKKQKHFKK